MWIPWQNVFNFTIQFKSHSLGWHRIVFGLSLLCKMTTLAQRILGKVTQPLLNCLIIWCSIPEYYNSYRPGVSHRSWSGFSRSKVFLANWSVERWLNKEFIIYSPPPVQNWYLIYSESVALVKTGKGKCQWETESLWPDKLFISMS